MPAVNPATIKAAIAVATEARGRGPQVLSALLGFVVALIIIVMAPLLLILAIGQAATEWMTGGGASQGGVPPGADAAMIARYEPIYKSAASQYQVNWYLLASIHKQESSFSHGSAPGIHSGVNSFGCCAGPMQFNVKDGTWDGHKNGYRPIDSERPADYPFEVEPHPSPYDDFDAIAAAAHKLKADGATQDLYSSGTFQAVCRYIGSCSNVENCGGINTYCDVLPRARRWAEAGIATGPPTGLPGGPPRLIGDDGAFPTGSGWSITTRFGAVDRLHANPHTGLDLGAPSGTPVYAIHGGKVSLVQLPGNVGTGYGNYVCIDHPDLQVASCYAHLLTGSVQVRDGQSVRTGARIASVGSTGRSTGPHLHFEIRSLFLAPNTLRYRYSCPAPYIGLDNGQACARSFI